MALLYRDNRFLDHKTINHPESAERIRRIHAMLDQHDFSQRCTTTSWQPAPVGRLESVHTPAYLEVLKQVSDQGGGQLDKDTVASRESWDVACLAAGAVTDAVQRVIEGDDRRALCLVRPPGHHALQDRAMGFCLLNNIALAARSAIRKHGLDRVLIVDWDVHHGNGTQDVFWRDSQVGFFSIHRWPFYPGSGEQRETGEGPGLGATRNLPVTMGTSRSDYLALFQRELEDFAARINPQLVLLSAGFDAHRLDPVGSLGLETEDYQPLTRQVMEIADAYCDGRLVSTLEGGYHLDALPECVQVHLECLMDQPTSRPSETSP
jgi:acetoin utilization deacetylase AcuC-like enzyme